MRSIGRGWLALPSLIYLSLLFLIPTGIVLGFSFLARDYQGGVRSEISWEAWRQAADTITLRTLLRTLMLAGVVTLADLAIGCPCAAALARLTRGWRQLMVFAFCFPLVTSLLLRTYGWMNLLPESWLGTLPGVALVLAFNYLPFVVLPLLRAFERADPSLHWAALDLGATPWQAFWRVTWPITRGAMWAGAALVFIPVMGEYLVPHFIGEGQVNLLGTVIWKEFDRRNWPYAAACSAWLIGLVAVAVVFPAARVVAARLLAGRRLETSEARNGS